MNSKTIEFLESYYGDDWEYCPETSCYYNKEMTIPESSLQFKVAETNCKPLSLTSTRIHDVVSRTNILKRNLAETVYMMIDQCKTLDGLVKVLDKLHSNNLHIVGSEDYIYSSERMRYIVEELLFINNKNFLTRGLNLRQKASELWEIENAR